MVLTLVLSVSMIAQLNQQTAFADKKAIEREGTLCPPGHQCSCNAATGVWHDFNPDTGQTFNINTGCTEDTGGVGGSSSNDGGSSSNDGGSSSNDQ